MESNEPRLFRTSIYTGGTSPIKIIQAGFYNEDCIVYDLKDSVSGGGKRCCASADLSFDKISEAGR